MTVIIGVQTENSVIMGSDSAMSVGLESIRISAVPKIFRRGDFLIGIAGDARLFKLLKYSVSLPEPEEADDDPEQVIARLTDEIFEACGENGALSEEESQLYIEGNILVGYKNVLYHLDAALSITTTISGTEAVGQGSEVALGAYTAMSSDIPVEARIMRSLEIAAYYKPHVRAPFHIMTL